jgi:hypothetical protein
MGKRGKTLYMKNNPGGSIPWAEGAPRFKTHEIVLKLPS